MAELNDEVQRVLVPAALPLTLRIVSHDVSPYFGDAMVVLKAGDLRVRVVKDKGHVFADFGSKAAPDEWFDSAVVFEYLQLSSNESFRDRDVVQSLTGLAAFLRTMGDELNQLFARKGFTTRRVELEAVRKRQAEQMWGIKLPNN